MINSGDKKFEPGYDLFAIRKDYHQSGWRGCVLVLEGQKSFGILGFMYFPRTSEEQGCAPIRMEWNDIEHIGKLPHICRPINPFGD